MNQKKVNPWEMIEMQAKTLQQLKEEHAKQILAADRIIGRYAEGIEVADEAIKALKAEIVSLRARVSAFEIADLNRSWNSCKSNESNT